jgi:hypothetical protein
VLEIVSFTLQTHITPNTVCTACQSSAGGIKNTLLQMLSVIVSIQEKHSPLSAAASANQQP